MSEQGKHRASLLKLAIRHPLRALVSVPYLVLFGLGWTMQAVGIILEEYGLWLDGVSSRFTDWSIEHIP